VVLGDAPSSDQEVLDALAAFARAKERDVIVRALDAARERLRMDAAYVSTITSEVQRVDATSGDTRPLGFEVGTTLPLDETYCDRMLRGDLPRVVPDTAADPSLLKLTVSAKIGAYVGVPITLADGRLHGTLCCASAAAHTALGADELRFMEVLAQIVGAEIDRSEGSRAAAVERMVHRHGEERPAVG
jgi:GAF domain-containing protein